MIDLQTAIAGLVASLAYAVVAAGLIAGFAVIIYGTIHTVGGR